MPPSLLSPPRVPDPISRGLSSMAKQIERGLSLQDDFATILTDDTFHDVRILCSDGIEIGACRAVLAARSSVFMAMLYGRMRESFSERVVLPSVNSKALQLVLRFIHTAEISPFPSELAIETYRAANFFLLPKLMKLAIDQAKDIHDLELACQLLNEAVATVPPNHDNKDLYSTLLGFFCTQRLTIGDLTPLSADALELILTQTTTTKFKTDEHHLLLCVIDWAWATSDDAPPTSERRALLDSLSDPLERPPPPTTAFRICLPSPFTHTLLASMTRHINFLLLCPHRLTTLMSTIDALASTAPHFLALAHYACANTTCSSDHPSGFRGIMHGEWDRDHLGSGLVLSDDGAVVEYPHRPTPTLGPGGFLQGGRTARLSQPLTMSAGGCHTISVVVEQTGVYSQQAMTEVGLVGSNFNENIALWTAQTGWSFQSYGAKSFLVTLPGNARDRYGKVVSNGDVVTLKLDMNSRTCSLEINGHDCGIAWKDLPDRVYPAVTLFPPAKYRIITYQ